jgi:hypothetical protein
MKAITCLDPIDQAHETILTPVDPKSVVKQTSHSLGLYSDADPQTHLRSSEEAGPRFW